MSTEKVVDRKEKKEKKSKSKKEKIVEQEADTAASVEEPENTDDVEQSDDGQKKRKRDHDELEIDVSLPEPPSKKALRKSKKTKPTTTSTGNTAEDSTTPAAKEDATDNSKAEGKERRTAHSIWIGNLPWTAGKQDLRDFLSTHTNGSITDSQIARLHMPAPSAAAAKDTRGRPAFKNRGFAYVDFDSAETLFTALQLTETPWGESGRNVLIKDAKSFEGRPEVSASSTKGPGAGKEEKPASKRVFVGNLAFEITKEDLETHFAQCGPLEGIHMATFEDSGKCKGYAWVTFSTLEGAEAAVRGFVLKDPEDEEDGEEAAQDQHQEDGAKDVKHKKRKPRKWFVNRLFGREIKREYAEDASVRYKKRYGGGAKREAGAGAAAGVGDEAPIREVNGDESQQMSNNNSSHDRRREQRRAQKYGSEFRKVDARTIAPGAALAHAPRASGAISAEGKKGTKVTFD
jgi:RNA recognition motif-containing protein